MCTLLDACVAPTKVTPVMDITAAEMEEAIARLDRAVQHTVAKLQWCPSDMIGAVPAGSDGAADVGNATATGNVTGSSNSSSSSRSTRRERFKGPDEASQTQEQARIRAEILSTRNTGLAGPFGPWLANPAVAAPSQELGRVCRYETSFELRESELVILMTAAHHCSATEWAIHVKEVCSSSITAVPPAFSLLDDL